MPIKSKSVPAADQKLPDVPKGYFNDEGFYVPTEDEVRSRWADIHPHKDLSVDEYRMKIWKHPPTRNLIPFFTSEDAKAYKLNADESRRNRIQKYKDDKNDKALVLDIIREELKVKNEDIDPWQLLQLRARMAMVNDDWDKVEELATKMLEYTTPKMSRVDTKVEDITKGKATQADMEKFISGELTYEQFIDKQRGN